MRGFENTIQYDLPALGVLLWRNCPTFSSEGTRIGRHRFCCMYDTAEAVPFQSSEFIRILYRLYLAFVA